MPDMNRLSNNNAKQSAYRKKKYSRPAFNIELIARSQVAGSPMNLDPEIKYIRNILIDHLQHPVLTDRNFLRYARLLVRLSQTNRMIQRSACLKPDSPPEPIDRFFSRLYGDEPPG